MIAKINKGSIFWLLPLNVVLMSMSMYNIEIVSVQKLHKIFFIPILKNWFQLQLLHDLANLSFQLIYMACSLFWPFLHCYYASSITKQVGDTALTAFGSNWFDLPIQLQKYIVLMMIRAQQTIYFTGFNITYCTMEALGKVFRGNTYQCQIVLLISFFFLIFSFGIHHFLTIWFSENSLIFEWRLKFSEGKSKYSIANSPEYSFEVCFDFLARLYFNVATCYGSIRYLTVVITFL